MNIKKHIPNSITCCNLISGCIAILFAFFGEPKLTLLWIVIGAVFDFFDGMAARLLKVSSPIGKELDSLADVVTFGVAPASLLFFQLSMVNYPEVLHPIENYIPFVAFIMAAASALRLAKFNLDERQTTSFIGLPTPANALFWSSLIVSRPSFLDNSEWSPIVLIVLMLVMSYFMNAEIPMFALKFKHWGLTGNEIKYDFALLSLVLICVLGIYKAWWLIIAAYMVTSIVVNKVRQKAA